jgi:hypothetical protein
LDPCGAPGIVLLGGFLLGVLLTFLRAHLRSLGAGSEIACGGRSRWRADRASTPLVPGGDAIRGIPQPFFQRPQNLERSRLPDIDLRDRAGEESVGGAEGLFLTPALAVRLPLQGRSTPLRLTGFCGEQTASRVRLAGLGLPGSAPRGATDLAAPLEGIVTVNPIFQALGVEAIVGQELFRRRSQLWRLDATPPRLRLW